MKRIGEYIYDRLFEYILSLVLLAIMLLIMLASREMMGADPAKPTALQMIQTEAGNHETQFWAQFSIQVDKIAKISDAEFRAIHRASAKAQMLATATPAQVEAFVVILRGEKVSSALLDKATKALGATADYFKASQQEVQKKVLADIEEGRAALALPIDTDSVTTATLGALPALAPMEKKGK